MQVKWSRILYSDFSTFKRDQERLISMTNDRGVDFLEGQLMMSNGFVDTSFFPLSDQTRVASLVNDHRIIYVLEVAKYYDRTTLPIIDQVLYIHTHIHEILHDDYSHIVTQNHHHHYLK